MATDGDIIAEMEVYASDGVHIGTVDAVEGGRIRLNTVASSVPVEGGHDHFVELADIVRIEGNRVHLKSAGVEAVSPGPGEAAHDPGRGAIAPKGTLNR